MFRFIMKTPEQRYVNEAVLVSLLISLNIFRTFFSSNSIVEFKEVII